MPDPYEGYMLEGQALSDAKTFGVALVCFKHALRLKPGNEEARLKVAECTRAKETERLNANRPDREELAYQSKLRSVATADSQRLKAIGYDALQNGDADYAELALTRAIKLKPNDPVLRQYMTGALLSEGKYSQAVNQFLAWDQISKLTLLDKLIFVKRIPDRDVASKFYSVLIEQNARDAHSLYSIALDCEGQSLKPETEAAIVAGLKVADDVNRHRLLSLQTQLKDKEKEEYQKFTPEEIAKLKSYVQPKRN
jgi:tetratricopeptide (TPR) repeat protein